MIKWRIQDQTQEGRGRDGRLYRIVPEAHQDGHRLLADGVLIAARLDAAQAVSRAEALAALAILRRGRTRDLDDQALLAARLAAIIERAELIREAREAQLELGAEREPALQRLREVAILLDEAILRAEQAAQARGLALPGGVCA